MDKTIKEHKRICFMFGAGAEQYFGLPSGIDFFNDSFLDEKTINQIVDGLETTFTKQDYFGNYKYTKDKYYGDNTFKKILYKWLVFFINDKNIDKYLLDLSKSIPKSSWEEFFTDIQLNHKKYPRKEVEADLHKTLRKVYSKYYTHYYTDKKLIRERKKIIGDIEKLIEGNVLSEFFFIEEEKDYITMSNDLPKGFGNILDSHFHTIIDPKKYGPNNFSKLINYYWTIFFSIYSSILGVQQITSEFVSDFVDNIEQRIQDLYSTSIGKEIYQGSYYSLINEKLKTENIILEGILTSNYFKHVDILDLPDEKVSFLNGKLNLFETPETLEVLDLNKNNIINRKNIYFPFLFGQSYLKPIVSQHQINEFHKMSNILENADILVILGYGLNEDDNHINSYFREFAKEGKQIFYVSNSDKDFYKYLKLENNDNFKNIIVDFKLHKEEAKTNAAIVDQIFTEINNL